MRHDDPTLTAQPPTSDEPSPPAPAPPHIGKYRVEKLLGRGSFGLVYLAYDGGLDRFVAIKVPHRRLVARPEDAEPYLAEARTLARLDHSNIVPVYESGHTDDWPLYVVSKYVPGSNLARRIADGPVPILDAAGLVATVAEALQHAHQHRVVHRDVKPGNILIDPDGKAYVADFGLAMSAENVGRGPVFAGTPAYMSPEQARREGHRVDGRTDIFSLGVVFYELLTGGRPFRGATQSELLEQIQTYDPVPPRQVADGIPAELERICLKALAKRAADRYSTARDLADDLRHFLKEFVGAETLPIVPRAKASPDAAPPPASDREAVKVVPKGLRSFDAHDMDFFLSLLPGPRDRDGLPESIRSWKTRIEDADDPFSVGLIYGPSGCGKSSLLKAGLLPRLSDRVTVVCVEATAAGTEARLLNGLRKRFPGLPAEATLPEAVAALRSGLAGNGKVLIVLDQFEQWLHAHPEPHTELVKALRHCDGGRVQCLVLVRDDFWLPVSRFTSELEVDLVPNRNVALVDLFDPDHARKVLTAFGRAYGKLPEKTRDLSREQTGFLDQAVAGLAQDRKIICVRLAVFADMMKGRPWTPAGLTEVGGPQGIGVSFLEDTFSSPAANPRHRRHQATARAVLRALLPDAGDDIKGNMRSETELRTASGYGPAEFADLIRALDGDVRLITPTDPAGADRPEPADEKFYQLTHDYLVRPLRDWLTRKQRETRRGRAELRLAERAAEWTRAPGPRHLPSLSEWAGIRLHTRGRTWTLPQRRMMRAADVYYLGRCLAIGLVVTVVGLGLGEWSARLRTDSYFRQLMSVPPDDLAGFLDETEPYHGRLRARARHTLATETAADRQHRAAALLARSDSTQRTYLYEELLRAEPAEFGMLRDALARMNDATVPTDLWRDTGSPDRDRRFRAACALATFDPDNRLWAELAGGVVDLLMDQPALMLSRWAAVLEPVRDKLLPALADQIERFPSDREGRKDLIALFGAFSGRDGRGLALLTDRIRPLADGPDPARAPQAANLAAAAAALGRDEVAWPLLRYRADPTVRSYLIERLPASGVEPAVLARRLADEPDTSVRRALLLALGGYPADRLAPYIRKVVALYETDPDSGIHAAAGWALRRWGAVDATAAIDQKLKTGKPEGNRQWYVNQTGLTFAVFRRSHRLPGERAIRLPAVPDLAVAATEVTEAMYREFQKDRGLAVDRPDTDQPVALVTWDDAAAFCNWLSRRAKIPEKQWCYVEANGRFHVASGYWQLEGYRLPTEPEWEFACRAGAETPWHFGRADAELMNQYGWWAGNAHQNGERKTFPVGRLKPNDLGLFDMHGNVSEWCQELNRPADERLQAEEQTAFRGGAYSHPYSNMQAHRGMPLFRAQPVDSIGIRVVRSLPVPPR
jgi:eukaryotic-like serine/threonine-protein kinase